VLRRIVVGYHDSASARRALEEAVRLAQLEGARLIVVAVAQHRPWLDGVSVAEIDEEHERSQDSCHLWLWAAEAYAAAHGVAVRSEIRIGNLAQQLAAAAAAHHADLLVVGRSSCMGLRARLLGTRTERLCRHFGGPLLIVPAAA